MENTVEKTKKPTLVSQYTEVKAILAEVGRDDLAEFIETRIAQAEKKNKSGEKKQTKEQVANEQLKSEILETMESGKSYRIADMIKTFPSCEGLSTSKVSSLVRQLKDAGMVVRSENKGTAYFTKAQTVGEE